MYCVSNQRFQILMHSSTKFIARYGCLPLFNCTPIYPPKIKAEGIASGGALIFCSHAQNLALIFGGGTGLLHSGSHRYIAFVFVFLPKGKKYAGGKKKQSLPPPLGRGSGSEQHHYHNIHAGDQKSPFWELDVMIFLGNLYYFSKILAI